MSWFDTSSITGLLSQAQKSIDKVLDIPTDVPDREKEDGGKPTVGAVTDSKLSLSKHQEKKSGEPTFTGSWLSGDDSFWGSFINQANADSNKKDAEKGKNKHIKENPAKKEGSETVRVSETFGKSSKLSSKSQNSKRTNVKRASKKKKAADDLEKLTSQNNLTENYPSREKVSQEQNKLKDVDESFKESVSTESEVNRGCIKEDKQNDETKGEKVHQQVSPDEGTSQETIIKKEVSCLVEDDTDNVYTLTLKTDEDLFTNEEADKPGEAKNIDGEDVKREMDDGRSGKAGNGYMESKIDAKEIGDVEVDDAKSQEQELDDRIGKKRNKWNERTKEQEYNGDQTKDPNFDEVVDADKYPKLEKNENDKGGNYHEERKINGKELDSFYSTPVAASTPYVARTKETLVYSNINSDDEKSTGQEDLVKASEMTCNQLSNLDDVASVAREALSSSEKNYQDLELLKNNTGKSNENAEPEAEDINSDSITKENQRLLQVVEVRESKLVELSKENLSLQETNAILRSQLKQLEDVHKGEESEFEDMKEEFTKRISTTENKLQAAAKERDTFKQLLEETQKCLSSDNERLLEEFQVLSQEKDKQIAGLLEEGEKLSKEVLQRNNNIKKLRAKEKETNVLNQNLSTRLAEAESEIERLTGILKERDEHKKSQDDAIKQLNAHIKKQDDQIAKQKVELDELSTKLPSLQTALDNAYKEIAELHKVNAAKSNEVQEATLSVEMTAKEELRMAMEKLKKESQKECDVLALEVTDLQTQLSRSEQQAARREDNLRQEISYLQMGLQEAETRNQELTESVSLATRPLLRQIENLQHSYASQQTSWEKLEKNLTERLAEAQSQQATAQERERAATEKCRDLNSRVSSLESQVGNYRQEKSRIEAELEIEKTKSEALEDYKSRETGKIEALRNMHLKKLEAMMVEKTLLEQQLVVERTKLESDQKKVSRLEEQLREKSQRDIFPLRKESMEADEVFTQGPASEGRSRNTSTSSQFSLTDTVNRGLPSGGTAILEELHATIRNKEGELSSMQSTISTLEAGRESLTKELTTLMTTNENLVKENEHLCHLANSFQELQTKYNALLQMYGEKQEETEELKLDLQDIKIMYKAQIQELLSRR